MNENHIIFLLLVCIIFIVYFSLTKKISSYRKLVLNFKHQLAEQYIAFEDVEDLYSSTKQEYFEYVKSQNLQAESNQKNLLSLKETIDALNLQIISYKEEIENQKHSVELLKAKHKAEIKESIKTAKADALKKSRSIIRGQASEHLAPFVIPNTNPKDYRFMGNPVDYICFDGLSDILDGQSDSIKGVRFIDIKTGKSGLNKPQRRIRTAIEKNLVTFEILNMDNLLENRNSKDSDEEKLG